MRCIQGGLTWPKILDYLWPFWVASHGNEVVRLTILAHNGHGILTALLHISGRVLVS